MAPQDPLASRQVLILSSVEWDAAWQRHQSFAQRWARAGHEVFFVENTGLRNPRLEDLARIGRRLRRACAPRRRQEPPRGIKLFAPLVLPPTTSSFRLLNDAFLVPRLAAQLRAAGLRDGALAVCYLPSSTTLALLSQVAAAATVYDCVDNFYGQPSRPSDLAETEKTLLERADLVLTSSRTLFDQKAPLHARVLELHHGVSSAFFIDARPRGFKRLAYFGTLWSAIDYAPLRALAEAGCELSLIGPQKEPPPPMPESVRFLPPVSHAELPGLLKGFDALLLPYADTSYNQGVIPAKTYECLATGLPVLASPLPALERLADVLTICTTPADWVRALRALEAAEASGERRRARLSRAREHMGAAQFERLREAIAQAWPAQRRPAQPPSAASRLLRGISWIGAFYGLAKFSTLLTQMAAGRLLGPLQYGKANLVLALSAYLQIIPMLGFPLALSKFAAGAKDEQEARRVIGATIGAFLLWALAGLGLIELGHGFVSAALRVEDSLFQQSVLLSYCVAGYTVLSSPLLGLGRFEKRGAAEAAYGLSAPLLLLLFFALGQTSYRAMIWALCASFAGATVYVANSLGSLLRPRLDWAAAAPALRYALVASLSLLATACVLAPARLILHHSFTPREVGIFSAYFTATVQIALALLTMLSAVLVPIGGRPDGQRALWQSYRRWRLPFAGLAWLGFAGSGSAALLAFGGQYPLRWEWTALFSLAAALLLVHGIAAALLAARDFRALVVSVAGSLAAGAGNIVLGLWLIPGHGITGAAAALVGGYLLGLSVFALCGRFLKKELE